MKRALFWFGFLLAMSGVGLSSFEVVAHRPPHPTSLYLFGGMVGLGAVLMALMADPKSLLALMDRVLAFRFGRSRDSGVGSDGGS